MFRIGKKSTEITVKDICIHVYGATSSGRRSLLCSMIDSSYIKNSFSTDDESFDITHNIRLPHTSLQLKCHVDGHKSSGKTRKFVIPDIAIFTLDLSEKDGMNAFQSLYNSIRGGLLPTETPVMIVATKADKRVITPLQIQHLSDDLILSIVETSAKTKSGMESLLKTLIQQADQLALTPPSQPCLIL